MSTDKISGFYTTKELCERYKIKSKMTLWRWQRRKNNPFPKPTIGTSGSQSRWAIESVHAWENAKNITPQFPEAEQPNDASIQLAH